MLAVFGLSATAAIAGSLDFMYPNLAGQFGADLTVGKKTDFPAATPDKYQLGQAGVFYVQQAKTYISHLAAGTKFSLNGTDLVDQLSSENFVKDSDGSYWVALYQRCVHLGCTVPFRNDCDSFKCPCHGSHYNVDGEYLDGPAPRSLDRFALRFSGTDVIVSTGSLNQSVPHPDVTTRIIPVPAVQCT
jgi:cytochrome b6-f complex iron-sulfur subunit